MGTNNLYPPPFLISSNHYFTLFSYKINFLYFTTCVRSFYAWLISPNTPRLPQKKLSFLFNICVCVSHFFYFKIAFCCSGSFAVAYKSQNYFSTSMKKCNCNFDKDYSEPIYPLVQKCPWIGLSKWAVEPPPSQGRFLTYSTKNNFRTCQKQYICKDLLKDCTYFWTAKFLLEILIVLLRVPSM